jgi:hypothetical protein
MGGVIQVGDQGQPQPTNILTLSSTLRQIKDKGNVLYDRINAEDYEEHQEDIQAVSGIAEDIQDAVLDYQVSRSRARGGVVSLTLGLF